MIRKKKLPQKADEMGNVTADNDGLYNDMIYLSVGIDGADRCYSHEDPFCQGPEYNFDEFH